jgi:hypothetical protein
MLPNISRMLKEENFKLNASISKMINISFVRS